MSQQLRLQAIASLVIAVLVDRGVLRYEDRVVKYWPEYGANGKENTTIEDVLTHKVRFLLLKKKSTFRAFSPKMSIQIIEITRIIL